MPRMTPQDMEVAAAFLDTFSEEESDAPQRAACQRVAEFLMKESHRRTTNTSVAAVAKEKGISRKEIRAALKKGAKLWSQK